MTAVAVLSAAAALLVWPDRRTERRRWLTRGRSWWPDLDRAPAGLPVPAVAAAGAAVVGAIASTPLVGALAAVLTALAARGWLARRRAAGLGDRLRYLADGLAALAAELRSGRPLAAATDAAVAACGDDESGRVLARAVRDPRPTAHDPAEPGVLDDALDRIRAGVRLSVRTGCSLAGVLGAIEDDLRVRLRHRDELRVATAGPRASALLLAGLPVLGLLMGSGVGADPWAVLTTTGAGQVLLVLGVTLEVAGLAWSGRLVRRVLG